MYESLYERLERPQGGARTIKANINFGEALGGGGFKEPWIATSNLHSLMFCSKPFKTWVSELQTFEQ